jgi:hypothetical protein
MAGIYRHGDVDLLPVNTVPKGAKKEKHSGEFVLAWGEVTGHAHRLKVKDPKHMEIYETEEGTILKLKAAATLTHEEHDTITIQPGIYRQRQEREYNYFEKSISRVID